jgi:hypothetical protein
MGGRCLRVCDGGWGGAASPAQWKLFKWPSRDRSRVRGGRAPCELAGADAEQAGDRLAAGDRRPTNSFCKSRMLLGLKMMLYLVDGSV